MKRVLSFLISVFVFGLCLYGQNNAVIGLVKLQNSGSQPLADVAISGFFATEVYSKTNGMFEIRFSGKKPGDRVAIDATKEGYEVVNADELEKVIIQSDPLPITIVMCKKGQRNKAALEYYNIITQSADAALAKQIKTLNAKVDALDEDDDQRKALYSQMEELQKQNDDLKAQAQDMAIRFAGVDLDMASAMQKAAIEALNTGDVQKAIAALDETALAQSLQDAQEEQLKAQERLAETEKAIQESIANYIMLAQLHKTALDADAAYKNYALAIKADTTNFDYVLEFAQFVSRLQKKEEAIKWYGMAARHAQNLQDSTRALTELANEVLSNRQFADAESRFLKVLEMLENGAVNPSEEWVAKRTSYIHRRLCDIYYTLRRADESKEHGLISLKSYQRLVKRNSDEEIQLGLADAQKSLGNAYSRSEQFDKSDSLYKQAFVIYAALAKSDPGKYNANLAGIYRAIGGNYLNIGKSDSSAAYFVKAIPLYEEMNEKSFHKYDSDLAWTEYGLANNYYLMKDYTKADSVSTHALEMYRQLARNKALSFNAVVAQVLALRGAILTDSDEYQTAEKEYKEALEIYTPLHSNAPDRFRYPLADCYEGVSKLYNLLSRFADAEEAARKGLATFPEKVSINTSLALALLYQAKFDEAKVIYVQFKDQRYARPGTPVTYADIFLEDLNALEEKGITHPDVTKVRKLLNRS